MEHSRIYQELKARRSKRWWDRFDFILTVVLVIMLGVAIWLTAFYYALTSI